MTATTDVGDQSEWVAECDAKLLDRMRALMVPAFDPTEAGGIYLVPADPEDDEALETYAALAEICPDPAGATAVDTEEGQQWIVEVLTAMAGRFIANGKLEPGIYHLDSSHQHEFAPSAETSDGITVEVSPDSLTLLRWMNTHAYGPMVMLMDSKRPYGDMSYFYIDMATALGEPVPLNQEGDAEFSAEAIERYDRLHGQMLEVVQVFWRYAVPENLDKVRH
ncbi:hypothetical protein DBR33_10725 [Stenotrophomonas sp. HMWF022]|uniref:hypothetical protein n=1 Tax=Stenotrophomonas sp. HMWF023 TaxID=2056859 RepID=UPI000D4C859A|nr:hypothetical protein [Stenotrophomonas sp. HMWF023]PTT43118.1 hypothetical protein DBR33_10725 [Stenotrophomonas sp. HMWF022]